MEAISILTPTYDRRKFVELMKCNVKNFDYDKEKITWIILDSWSIKGDNAPPLFKKDELEKVKKELHPISIDYTYLSKAMTIGQKRNWLSKRAKTKYMICMDSDDLYVPEYLQYSINTLKDNKKECCGSNQMIFMYPKKDYLTTFIQCEALRQIHEATLCYTKKHYKRMNGFCNSGFGEGSKMVDGCNPNFFILTQVASCMMCICHDDNSVPKEKFITKNNKIITEFDTAIDEHMEVLKDIFKPDENDYVVV
jgi:cellulose synthase/poly-beta-1,6-N-acetylglucosamine synthase-like glycosyltransferase